MKKPKAIFVWNGFTLFLVYLALSWVGFAVGGSLLPFDLHIPNTAPRAYPNMWAQIDRGTLVIIACAIDLTAVHCVIAAKRGRPVQWDFY